MVYDKLVESTEFVIHNSAQNSNVSLNMRLVKLTLGNPEFPQVGSQHFHLKPVTELSCIIPTLVVTL